MSKTNIYILKCANNKYYVGKSQNPEKRFLEHINGDGSTWTSKHEPKEIVKIIPNASSFDEDRYVKEYMNKYGIENVRGGSYVKEVLDDNEKYNLQKEIRGANDCCIKCGSKGHFIKDCFANSDVDGKKKNKYSKKDNDSDNDTTDDDENDDYEEDDDEDDDDEDDDDEDDDDEEEDEEEEQDDYDSD
jgi:predicted GIY-YIG superfamily endonuclease